MQGFARVALPRCNACPLQTRCVAYDAGLCRSCLPAGRGARCRAATRPCSCTAQKRSAAGEASCSGSGGTVVLHEIAPVKTGERERGEVRPGCLGGRKHEAARARFHAFLAHHHAAASASVARNAVRARAGQTVVVRAGGAGCGIAGAGAAHTRSIVRMTRTSGKHVERSPAWPITHAVPDAVAEI